MVSSHNASAAFVRVSNDPSPNIMSINVVTSNLLLAKIFNVLVEEDTILAIDAHALTAISSYWLFTSSIILIIFLLISEAEAEAEAEGKGEAEGYHCTQRYNLLPMFVVSWTGKYVGTP